MNIKWHVRLGALVSQTNPKDYWPKYWVATNQFGDFLTAVTPDSTKKWCVALSPNKIERFDDIHEAKRRAEDWIRKSVELERLV